MDERFSTSVRVLDTQKYHVIFLCQVQNLIEQMPPHHVEFKREADQTRLGEKTNLSGAAFCLQALFAVCSAKHICVQLLEHDDCREV
jgi:hypothetical protein